MAECLGCNHQFTPDETDPVFAGDGEDCGLCIDCQRKLDLAEEVIQRIANLRAEENGHDIRARDELLLAQLEGMADKCGVKV